MLMPDADAAADTQARDFNKSLQQHILVMRREEIFSPDLRGASTSTKQFINSDALSLNTPVMAAAAAAAIWELNNQQLNTGVTTQEVCCWMVNEDSGGGGGDGGGDGGGGAYCTLAVIETERQKRPRNVLGVGGIDFK